MAAFELVGRILGSESTDLKEASGLGFPPRRQRAGQIGDTYGFQGNCSGWLEFIPVKITVILSMLAQRESEWSFKSATSSSSSSPRVFHFTGLVSRPTCLHVQVSAYLPSSASLPLPFITMLQLLRPSFTLSITAGFNPKNSALTQNHRQENLPIYSGKFKSPC